MEPAQLRAVDTAQLGVVPVAAGTALRALHRLGPHIAWRGPWQDVAQATTLLRERRLHGKAVLDVN